MERHGTGLLDTLTNTPEWHAARRLGIGGSDAAKVMSGDWLALWEEKTGRRDSDDLSDILQPMLGKFTESFNLSWFEKHTGIAVSTDNCEGLVHPDQTFMRANLDGVCDDGSIFEAKHVNAFAKPDEVAARYYPQLQHNMFVTGSANAYLSVIFGNHKWEFFVVGEDWKYQRDMLKLDAKFWSHVESDAQPTDKTLPTVTVSFDEMREADMVGSNAWFAAAADWLENKRAAKVFKAANDDLKELTEPDVKRAFGGGVETNRAKNGAIRIKEMK